MSVATDTIQLHSSDDFSSLRKIAADVQIVLLADHQAQARLQALVEQWPPPHMEVRHPEDFLYSYDMDTEVGEARKRSLEILYSGLRGKLIARLVVANLNPEAIREAGGICPLESALTDWKTINARRNEFLGERFDEGMTLVTIVVAEKGDWLASHKKTLESLAQGEYGGIKIPGRCYLMSRKLELGSQTVLHAMDLWPLYVRSLLHHVVGLYGSPNKSQRVEDGIYGWRSLIITADPGADVVARHVSESIQLLLKSSATHVEVTTFTANLSSTLFMIPGEGPESPFPEGKWKDKCQESILDAFCSPLVWSKHAVDVWRGKDKHSGIRNAMRRDCLELREKLLEWVATRWELFEGNPVSITLPPPEIRDLPARDTGPVLDEIAIASSRVEKSGRNLQENYHEYKQAIHHYLSPGHRMIPLFALFITFSYSTIVFLAALTKVLGLSIFEAALAGISMVAMTILGMLTVLVSSHWLQTKACKSAYKKICDQTNEHEALSLALELKKSILVAEGVLSNANIQAYLEAMALHQRSLRNLQQIRKTLENEGIDHTSESQEQDRQDKVPWLEFVQMKIKADKVASLDLNESTSKALYGMRADEDWQHQAKRARTAGFVPAGSLRFLTNEILDYLRTTIANKLGVAATQAIEDDVRTNPELTTDLVSKHEFFANREGGRPSLFSVDVDGGTVKSKAWAYGWFQKAFLDSDTHLYKITPDQEAPLPSGILAVVYSEAALEIIEPEDSNVLRFNINSQK